MQEGQPTADVLLSHTRRVDKSYQRISGMPAVCQAIPARYDYFACFLQEVEAVKVSGYAE